MKKGENIAFGSSSEEHTLLVNDKSFGENRKGSSPRVRLWSWTLFDFTELNLQDLRRLSDETIVTDIGWQEEECPTSKKRHLQGFIRFKEKRTFKSVKRMLGIDTIHVEPSRGTIKDNVNYCSKNETKVDGGDNFLYATSEMGARNDARAVLKRIKEGAEIEEIREEFPGYYLRYYKHIKREIHERDDRTVREELLKEYDDVDWYPWQKSVLRRIAKEPDRRRVFWYHEETGCVGKSFIAKYLLLKERAYYVTGGKQIDILYGFNGESIVIYDLPRTYAENLDAVYNTIECFKNGIYLSTKYETEQRVFKVPHVIVFANFEPDYSKLSEDRYKVMKLQTLESDEEKRPKVIEGNTKASITEEEIGYVRKDGGYVYYCAEMKTKADRAKKI